MVDSGIAPPGPEIGRVRCAAVVDRAASSSDLDEIEAWFVGRGVPHFVERHEPAAEIWGRAIPLLTAVYLLRSLNVLKLTGSSWSIGENLLAALFGIAVALATWVGSNLLRRRPALARPTRVGPVELVVFIVAPALPSVLFGQWSDGFESIAGGILALVVLWAITSYGVPSLLRWAWARTRRQLMLLASMITRALPLLLLFTTFLFINAEVWQVAGTLHGVVYVLVLGIFFLLGALFLFSRLPGLMRKLNHFGRWSDVRRLVAGTPAAASIDTLEVDPGEPVPDDHPDLRARFNIGLFTLFSQGIQITAVAVILTMFFVVLGVLAIPEPTIAAWTGMTDVQVLLRLRIDGRELVVSEPLIRVAGFLGSFSGMYFTVQLATDASYREEFAEDVGPQLRQALAVRCVYRRTLGRTGATEPMEPRAEHGETTS